jgi:hypothetical protein
MNKIGQLFHESGISLACHAERNRSLVLNVTA